MISLFKRQFHGFSSFLSLRLFKKEKGCVVVCNFYVSGVSAAHNTKLLISGSQSSACFCHRDFVSFVSFKNDFPFHSFFLFSLM